MNQLPENRRHIATGSSVLAISVVLGCAGAALGEATPQPPEKAPPKPSSPAPAAPADATPATDGATKSDGPTPPAIGSAAPTGVELTTDRDARVSLESLWKDKPVVIMFYRGGWCPFCTRSLSAWGAKMDEFKKLGVDVVAIALEKPSEAAKTTSDHKLPYRVLVDSNGAAARAFGLLFTVDDKTRKLYEGYGIDLAKRNANGQWQLPHPGTFLIGTDGKVKFSHADKDYKVRVSPDEVLKVAQTLSKPAATPAPKSGG